ncbi:MAG: hypothetical protein ACRD38_07845, partial [Nitrososphaerales archaeon]
SDETKDKFASILASWIQSGEPSIYQKGLTYFGSIYSQLSSTIQDNVMGVILQRTSTMINADPNVRTFLNFLIQNYNFFSNTYKQKTFDFLKDQLNVTNSQHAQSIALEYIPKLELGKRASEILKSILDFAKNTSDGNMINICKNALKQLNSYGSKEFWKEVKTILGDDVYKE